MVAWVLRALAEDRDAPAVELLRGAVVVVIGQSRGIAGQRCRGYRPSRGGNGCTHKYT